MPDADRTGRRPRPTPDGSARGGPPATLLAGARARQQAELTRSGLTDGLTDEDGPGGPVGLADPAAPVAAQLLPSTFTGSGTAAASPPARYDAGGIPPSQVVAAAGSAIVSAARVGRLLGRSGWRIARQLPGARVVETEAKRLQQSAMLEARRLLQVPTSLPGNLPGLGGLLSPEEQRAAALFSRQDGSAPLRSAMSELLERSVEATRRDSHEYLFGTIMSQLVPDEARILAALSAGGHVAAADLVVKQRRGGPRVLLAHASSIGRQAGLANPDNTPTYVGRLLGFGLVEIGPEDPALSTQYDILATEPAVQAARETLEPRRRGAAKLARKTLGLSTLGRQFWAAADPTRPAR